MPACSTCGRDDSGESATPREGARYTVVRKSRGHLRDSSDDVAGNRFLAEQRYAEHYQQDER
jgi:hypothetical protein